MLFKFQLERVELTEFILELPSNIGYLQIWFHFLLKLEACGNVKIIYVNKDIDIDFKWIVILFVTHSKLLRNVFPYSHVVNLMIA